MMIGKVPLNINLLVPVKESLMDQASKKGISMTELITTWVIENDPELEKQLKTK